MKRSNFYYTLVIREDGVWGPQFGDYDREAVEQEAEDSYSDTPRRDRKIICTVAGQRWVDAAVAKLNKEG